MGIEGEKIPLSGSYVAKNMLFNEQYKSTRFLIIAHYDLSNSFSTRFLEFLKVIENSNFRCLVVTTSASVSNLNLVPQSIDVILRPNLGYDFYSYKVGINSMKNYTKVESLILINSSMEVLDPDKYKCIIHRAFDELSISAFVCLVESKQYFKHAQSFFLGFTRNTIDSPSVKEFFENIPISVPKKKLILDCEIGLSRLLTQEGIPLNPLFKLPKQKILRVLTRYIFNVLIHHPRTLRLSRQFLFNFSPSHYAFDLLLKEAGIIKQEIVLENRRKLSRRKVEKIKRNYMIV